MRIGTSFISAAKDAVGGTNGSSGKSGDEEASMLWFDGMRVEHFKESSTGVSMIIIRSIIIFKVKPKVDQL